MRTERNIGLSAYDVQAFTSCTYCNIEVVFIAGIYETFKSEGQPFFILRCEEKFVVLTLVHQGQLVSHCMSILQYKIICIFGAFIGLNVERNEKIIEHNS